MKIGTAKRKPLSIAIFTDAFLPQVNGVVTVTIDLAEQLADRGHRVYIIAPKHKRTPAYRHKNVTIQYVPSIPALFYDNFRFTSVVSRSILTFLKKKRVDVIHFQTPITLGAQAILAARILKKPLVGTYHTLFSDPQYMQHVYLSSKLAQRASWTYAHLYYDRCDLITCPTAVIQRELRKRKFPEPITVISNGVDPKEFCVGNGRAVRKKYSPHGKMLLFIGRIAHEKNIPYLLDCFALIHRARPSTKLVIVGDGPQMAVVQERIKALRLTDAVIMTGAMPHHEIISSGIYKAADVFVTASTTETQGITLLEAHANGLPTVGIAKRGVGEVVRHGKNGILVRDKNKKAFAEAVLRILGNDALRAKLAKEALVSVQDHDKDCIADQWENTYNTLIAQHSKL